MLPPGLFGLLRAARSNSALDHYAANPGTFPHGDRAFARSVAGWQRQGLLDEDYRCPARLIENPPLASGLTAPLTLHLDLTSACNLHCVHCYVGDTRVHHDLSAERVRRVFAELEHSGVPVLVLSGGEPLVRPDLFEILQGLSQHPVDAYLCTNATLIDGATAARLVATSVRGYSVSLDGPDAASHDRVRGPGSFDSALAGLRALVCAGARYVQLRVTATRPIVDRLLEFAPLAAELGISRVVIKPLNLVGRALKVPELALDREAYLAAIPRTLAHWPAAACILEMGDGIPHRPPDWTRIARPFSCPGGTTTARVSWDARVLACSQRSDDDWSLADHDVMDCWRNSPGLVRWRNLEPGPGCQRCASLASCGGGCRMRALATGGGLGDADPWMPCAQDRHGPAVPDASR